MASQVLDQIPLKILSNKEQELYLNPSTTSASEPTELYQMLGTTGT